MNEGFSFRCHSDIGIPHFGHPHSQNPIYMGIAFNLNPMPISLGFWEWGCPYHCNNATSETRSNWVELTVAKTSGTVTGQ